jgi:hypothetical protein
MLDEPILQYERKVLALVLKAYGERANDLIIGGGYAPIIYRLYFAHESSPVPVMTMDLDALIRTKDERSRHQALSTNMDSLIKRREDRSEPLGLGKQLIAHGFKWHPKSISESSPESYKKEIDGQEVEIEFITDKNPRDRDAPGVKIDGVVAQPLSYLEMSFDGPWVFKADNGISGKVVASERWAFHKGLTFVRRKKGSNKHYKDLYGFWFVLTRLGDLSEKTLGRMAELMKDKKPWAKTLKKEVGNWIQRATPEDWSKLEMQDPSGFLTKERFIALAEAVLRVPID